MFLDQRLDYSRIEIADDDVQKQLSQIQNFIAAKVDAIIVNAVDTSATAPMTKLANDAGIPIVYVNRQPIDVDALGPKGAFVASNEVDSGTLETKEICRLLGGKGDILIMVGDLANQAAVQRTKDIHDVIATPECTPVSDAARLLVRRAGEPEAARTLREAPEGAGESWSNGMYIVAGTGSRSDRYAASAT